MAKRKKLPSLLNNLNEAYLSTLNYYVVGYAADWLWEIGIKNNVYSCFYDITKSKLSPECFNCPQLLNYKEVLNSAIDSCFKDANISTDEIENITMNFNLKDLSGKPFVFAVTKLTLKDESVFISKEFKCEAYELGGVSGSSLGSFFKRVANFFK